MTEWLHFDFSLSCIGEGNGNPFHHSCLENPWMRGPGGLPTMGSHRIRHDWSDLAGAAKASAYLRLLMFLPAILIPACASSSPVFPMMYSAAAAKSRQLCSTLCDPIDGSSPGSSIPEILQARTLEWVAIFFSNAWKWKVKSLSRVRLLAPSWTAAYQAPPSTGF